MTQPNTDNINVEGDAVIVTGDNPQSGGQSSGAHARTDIPGSEQFYVSPERGMGNVYNAAEEAIFMPADDPGRYLPRAIIDESYLIDYIETNARLRRMYTGYENPVESHWLYFAGTLAIDGRGRRDFVDITTGERHVEITSRGAEGIRRRLLGNDNAKLSGG